MSGGALLPGRRYRMPVVFGPTPGPRQDATGGRFDPSTGRRETYALRFLTDAAILERWLPPRCRLDGDPVVTVEHVQLTEVAWLAGRGYSLLNVKFPIVYEGEGETARGPFLAVLWENRPEPIISGREELGYAKLYCELPPPRVRDDRVTLTARWDGHVFLEINLSGWVAADPEPPETVDGVIHHRYFPALADDSSTGIDHMAITPAAPCSPRIERYRAANGQIRFSGASWEQMPTMHHIATALSELPVLKMISAAHSITWGSSDLSNQRRLVD